ncbi:MAG: hypothetical protein VKK62_02510 [Synechococcaceae cyanobacterium]|nr:hypothetical protein [Synechococcaceae cyanobacterium]
MSRSPLPLLSQRPRLSTLLGPGRSGGATKLALLLVGVVLAGQGPALRAQDLVGCQLADGTLQCVPGLSADPQQQIRILRSQIAADQRLETAVQQSINGLSQLVLQGQAVEGALLQANAQGLQALPASAYHWYRKAPGRLRWELIAGASGPGYQIQRNDIAYELMVVIAVPSADGSQRAQSNSLGPVMAQAASSP